MWSIKYEVTPGTNIIWCYGILLPVKSERLIEEWASYQIRKIAGCACAGNAGNVFPRRRFQRKPLVSDPGMYHGTCVTHVPWCMSGSLTCGDGENVPGIPGACAPAILCIWKETHAEHVFIIVTSYRPSGCINAPMKHTIYDGVIIWEHLSCYWPVVREIHRWTMNSPHIGQWRGALMFSLICVWITGWVKKLAIWDAIAPIMTSV